MRRPYWSSMTDAEVEAEEFEDHCDELQDGECPDLDDIEVELWTAGHVNG